MPIGLLAERAGFEPARRLLRLLAPERLTALEAVGFSHSPTSPLVGSGPREDRTLPGQGHQSGPGSDQWHKLCALVLFKLGASEVEITAEDIHEFSEALGAGASIVADARNGRFVLRLVDGPEGERLAREEGGLPV